MYVRILAVIVVTIRRIEKGVVFLVYLYSLCLNTLHNRFLVERVKMMTYRTHVLRTDSRGWMKTALFCPRWHIPDSCNPTTSEVEVSGGTQCHFLLPSNFRAILGT